MICRCSRKASCRRCTLTDRQQVRQASQALVLEQGVADEAVAAALGQQFVEADVQLAKLLDIEVFHRAREQDLHGAAQQGQALRVGVEAAG